MESHRAYTPALLFILFLLSFHFEVICGDSAVVFLDSPTRQYFRHPSAKNGALSPFEIGATASVLLGFTPPPELSDASSSKLNEVLMPNPFDKPLALLMVEVTGAEGSELFADSEHMPFSSAVSIKVEGNQRVDIQLPEEDEVSLFLLDGVSSHTDCSDIELSDFASWLGGTYAEDASRPLSGELIIPIANSAFLRLHMSERADREFATSLVSLISNIMKTKEKHQVLTKIERSQAELIIGKFDGIKALQDHYGKEGIAQSGLEVFINSISKAFVSLQDAYQGRIAGVIGRSEQLESEQENLFHVTRVSVRPSARWLVENDPAINSTIIEEVIFVRTTLAWITGIILLIATLLGILYLLNMPLTKDTLLYSNVKLD